MQGIIPYGAQMLLAISGIAALGYTLTAFDVIPYLMYKFILPIVVLIFIFVSKDGGIPAEE